MNTPSHFLMTAALRKALPGYSIPRSAAYLGALAPDAALWVLSIGGIVYFESVLGWSRQATVQHLYQYLYFNDPVWKAAHNLLQAPILLLLGLGSCWLLRDRRPRASRWFAWFLAACLLHAIIDIATHHDDGPLILFPFDWSTRFQSLVSYWDRRHYGAEFAIFETALNVVLLGYLLMPVVWRWLTARFGALALLPPSSDRVE